MHMPMPTVEQLVGVPYLTRPAAGTITAYGALLGLDARLGVAGLPQSATGQTTILTGQNAPALIGRHYGPYPNPPLQAMLAENSIFSTILTAGRPVAYANAYPQRFLDRLKRGKGRLSANTQAAFQAGLKLRSGEDLRQGRAISAFLHNDFWPEELPLPRLTTRQAGQQLASLAREHTLTFFEFWYSDLLGHKQQRAESLQVIGMLDEFLAGIIEKMDLNRTLLLVISDHGNFEDWTTSRHTLNPSLTLLAGADFEAVIPRLHSLADIKPALMAYLFED